MSCSDPSLSVEWLSRKIDEMCTQNARNLTFHTLMSRSDIVRFLAAATVVSVALFIRSQAYGDGSHKRMPKSQRKQLKREQLHAHRKAVAPAKKQAAKQRKKAKSAAASQSRELFSQDELKCEGVARVVAPSKSSVLRGVNSHAPLDCCQEPFCRRHPAGTSVTALIVQFMR